MNRYKLLLLISLVFPLIFYSIPGLTQEKTVTTLDIGEKAPDFNLPGVDGKKYSLMDFNSFELLAVVFTCNHCPTAQAYEDRIKNFVINYHPKGVGLVAISPNSPPALSLAELGYSDLGDDLEDMKIRANDKSYNFPYLYDGENQEISIRYGPVATPHIFLFDKERNLQYSGRFDDTENPYLKPGQEDFINAVDALLANRKPEVQVTKTFGCSVKWAWKDAWTKQLIKDWAAEPVTLQPMDDKKISELLKESSGKLRLINIWATWCGPCVIEFPQLITINRMYRGRDFELITISADKFAKQEKALEFLKEKQASCKNIIYNQEDIYQLIEAVDKKWEGALPYTLLIDRDGKIIYRVMGSFEPLLLKKKIIEYLGRYYADDN